MTETTRTKLEELFKDDLDKTLELMQQVHNIEFNLFEDFVIYDNIRELQEEQNLDAMELLRATHFGGFKEWNEPVRMTSAHNIENILWCDLKIEIADSIDDLIQWVYDWYYKYKTNLRTFLDVEIEDILDDDEEE